MHLNERAIDFWVNVFLTCNKTRFQFLCIFKTSSSLLFDIINGITVWSNYTCWPSTTISMSISWEFRAIIGLPFINKWVKLRQMVETKRLVPEHSMCQEVIQLYAVPPKYKSNFLIPKAFLLSQKQFLKYRWNQFRSFSVVGNSVFFYAPSLFIIAFSFSTILIIYLRRQKLLKSKGCFLIEKTLEL